MICYIALVIGIIILLFLSNSEFYTEVAPKNVSFRGSRPVTALRHDVEDRLPIGSGPPAPHHPHRPHHRRYFPEFWPLEFVYGSDYVSKFNQNGIDPIYTVDKNCESICYLNRQKCYDSSNPLKERCALDYHNCMYDCFTN